MTDGLKPYPVMKDSGVPWLGEVPAHWKVLPNRAVFSEVKERNHPNADMLSVTITKGVIRQKALLEDSSKKDSSNQDKSAYKLVRPGDIVYNKMRAWQGAVGVSEYEGIVSPAYVVQRPRAGIAPQYLHYLLRTPAFAKEAERWSYGITSDMWSLRPEHFKMIYSCLPPLPEQAAIVRFLNHADRCIRRYIRAKQKLIKLLEEQKQAIIHRAVTRGLDPNVRLRSSGVEWLGEVPEHWEVRRLKFLAQIKTGGHDTVHRKDDGEYPFFVRSQDVERIDSYSFDGEAVLTAGDGAGVAKVFHYVNGKFDYHQRVYKFSNFRHVRGRLFFHYLSCTLRFEAFRKTAKSTVDSLRLPMLQNFPVLLPPSREQDEMVEVLERQTQHLNQSLDAIRREIAMWGEYRTCLIADVVTGKLDVRPAAATLVDEADEQETVAADPLVDDEEHPGTDDLDPVSEEIEA